MLCKDPVTVNSQLYACGGCEPCRIKRKVIWTNRIMLEAGEHGSNAFVTLTYSDQNLPKCASGRATLAPEDVRNWLKRLRKTWSVQIVHYPFGPACVWPRPKLRFYLVGEYGDISERPHYHVALFGHEPCCNGSTIKFRGRSIADECCVFCRAVQRSWGKGDVDIGRLEKGSAQYLCGYVLKKMTRFDDKRLDGRMPEFARMSNRPGVGQRAMFDVADVLLRYGLDVSEPDVPGAIRRGSSLWPLGRYLRGQLRLMIGKEVTCPDEVLQESLARLRPLREAAFNNSVSFKAMVVETFAQDVLNRESRYAIHRKRGVL